MDIEHLSGAVEALIFVSGDPVPIKRLQEVLEQEESVIREAIENLSKRYVETGAGIQIMEVAGGFQLRTRPLFSEQVNQFLERKRKTTLSSPAMETIAIIAYKQPITRAEIEAIRGVAVDGVLKSLLDKRLIKISGVKEVPGRPNLYRTTKHFLEYFGISSLNDLPPIENIEKTYSSSSGVEEQSTQEQAGTETSMDGDHDNRQEGSEEEYDRAPEEPSNDAADEATDETTQRETSDDPQEEK